MRIVIFFLAIGFFFSANNANAQEKIDKKHTKVNFEVSGVCKMCKTRIEEAALFTKGVKMASWNKETQQIEVIYNHKKTSEMKVHEAIAAAGHRTEELKAKEEAYQKLPDCCKYREVEVH